jgi:hypothetical protein
MSETLIGKHVVFITKVPALNQCGVLQLSETGDEFCKLVPSKDRANGSLPWPLVTGELHVRSSLIQGILNVDTIPKEIIEKYMKEGTEKFESTQNKD